jgi:hypothetical protein
MFTWVRTADDLKWLKETHFKNMPKGTKCVLLHGSEDSPIEFEVFKVSQPTITDVRIRYVVLLDYASGLDEVYLESDLERMKIPNNNTPKLKHNYVIGRDLALYE